MGPCSRFAGFGQPWPGISHEPSSARAGEEPFETGTCKGQIRCWYAERNRRRRLSEDFRSPGQIAVTNVGATNPLGRVIVVRRRHFECTPVQTKQGVGVWREVVEGAMLYR